MDITKEILKEIKEIAKIAHKGQTRNDFVTPYIVHPMEVASYFNSNIDKAIAIGHDIFEDGEDNGVDSEFVRKRFIALQERLQEHEHFEFNLYIMHIGRVMGAIENLTHGDDDTYFDYIRDIKRENVKFKIADINANVSDDPAPHQIDKYKKALKILLSKI